jgi:hypothetical protein
VSDEQPKPQEARVSVAQLTGDASASNKDANVPLRSPRDEFLWKVVMDEPWDTSLGWADAQIQLVGADVTEVDRVMREAILDLHDNGLACFFEVESFGEDYSRTPREDEYLSREQLTEALAGGCTAVANGLLAPFLGVRATDAGRERVFELWPEDRERWERRRALP